ncbi:HNHc domain containing protein [uncultured Caudovirales phage]|uniref:HNHc domain containing protein n=1 Tax=uncultured Caudovirales phage TaxID=2100421 RepID=A0A6J5MUH5_9CAUD|nr:HNHc domain containing protein [uncultured Caudovirales phage]
MRNRLIVLEHEPVCHWCQKAKSTEADHLIETDRGGTDDIDNLVGSCKPCNATRGNRYLNNKRAQQQHSRAEHLGLQKNAQKTKKPKNNDNFLKNEKKMTPTPFSNISRNSHDSVQDLCESAGTVGVGIEQPRLVTPTGAFGSYSGLVGAWSEAHLGRTLFPWQMNALDGALEHDEAGNFISSTALISTGRQNGKTTMLSALVGFCLTELPRIWGRPVRIMSTAHELGLATEVFEDLREVFELLEESGLAKVTWAYGRHQVKMLDGSVYKVNSATGKKHGGTWDILIVDELWAISESTYFGALKPSQIAVPSPLAFLVSTAGDESSRAFLKLREQALGVIDSGERSDLFMAEWSLPTGVSPDDPQYWGYANPALGRTITMKGLESAAAAPDRSQYLRAHCNLWVAAANSWINPGEWAKRYTTNQILTGVNSVLAVDSSVDDSKYVGILCGLNSDGDIVASVAFTCETNRQMWRHIERLMEDPKLKLAITPTLDLHTPEPLIRRRSLWGYAEMIKYTGLVKSMITEGRLLHTGEEMLAEHVNRATLVKANGAVVLSSQKSPGPIECARCLVAAASLVSRPTQSGRAMMGSAR